MRTLEFISSRRAVKSSVQNVRGFNGANFLNHFMTDRNTKCAAYINFQLSTFDGDMKDAFNVKENPLKLFYAVSPMSMSVFFGNSMKAFKEHKEGERNTFFKKGEIRDINDFVTYSNGLIKCNMCCWEVSAKMLQYYPYVDDSSHSSLSFEVDKERERKLFKLVDFMKDMSIEGIERKMKPYEKYITEMMSKDRYVNGNIISKERQLYWMINAMPIKVNVNKDGEIIICYKRDDVKADAEMFFKYEKNFSIDTDNVSKGFFGFICRANIRDEATKFTNDKGEPMSDEEKIEEVLKMLDEVFKAYSL